MSPSKPRAKANTAAAAAAALAAEAARAEEAAQAAAADAELDNDVSDAVDVVESDAEASEEADAADAEAAAGSELEAAIAQRDDYLHQLQRHQAEFQNYRRRVETERRQQVAAGVSRLVESLLPVLDGCDAAAAQGHTEVAAVGQSLMVALGKAGLERISAVGEEFDPTQHEAVIVELAAVDADVQADPSTYAEGDAAADDSDGSETVADDARRDDADDDDHGGDADDDDLGEPSADEAEAPTADADSQRDSETVTEELRSGYRFDGRVLRAAMVKVRTG